MPCAHPGARCRLRHLTLAVRIVATIPYVWLRVRLLPLPQALAGLLPRESGPPSPPTGYPRAKRVGGGGVKAPPIIGGLGGLDLSLPTHDHIIRLTDRILERRVALLRPSCMLRSLVLFRFLREAGLPVRVHFGVAREDAALKGHSWLTLDGAPFAEPTDPTVRFQTVFSFPGD